MMLKKQLWVLVLSLVVIGAAILLSPAAMGYVTLELEPDRTSPLVTGELDNANPQIYGFTDVREVVTNDAPVNAESSRALLWVAFIIALAIFSASVIGAVLLYDRRR